MSNIMGYLRLSLKNLTVSFLFRNLILEKYSLFLAIKSIKTRIAKINNTNLCFDFIFLYIKIYKNKDNYKKFIESLLINLFNEF